MSEEAKTIDEETKTVETKADEETKPVSLQEFLNKSFECLFNQNVHLHRALAQVLQDEFKKQEDRFCFSKYYDTKALLKAEVVFSNSRCTYRSLYYH